MTGMELDRIEVKKTKYDSHNRIVEEEWEFWYPPEKSNNVGFNLNQITMARKKKGGKKC
jgi:hypothetical protein